MTITRDLSGNGAGIVINDPRYSRDRSRIAGQRFSITPSDTALIIDQNGRTTPIRALIATGAGNIVVEYADGRTNTLVAAENVWVECDRAVRVRSTSTTATGIQAVA